MHVDVEWLVVINRDCLRKIFFNTCILNQSNNSEL